jgi:PBP1b-binding outer membrane lipoprotein LpoB
MSHKLHIMLAGVILAFLLLGCSPSSVESYTNHNDNHKKAWYDEVIDGFGKTGIQDSMQKANAVAEYRVVYNQSQLCYEYYSLQVFEDSTGQFSFMVHYQEDLKLEK